MYDFAVEHDNALYDLTHTTFDNPTKFTLSLASPQDPLPSVSSPFFDFTEFESFGSSLYTQFNKDPQAWSAAGILSSNLPAPLPLSFKQVPGIVHEEVAAMPSQDATSSPLTSTMRLATPSLPQVAVAPSPAPSLSFSAPSAFSSPSPASIVDDDFTISDDDPEYGSPTPPRSTHASKRTSSTVCGTSAKKVRVYAATATSLPSRSVGRFPCSVPGCKQVCKTLGDLKRHENVLAHKPPAWECPRCHYHFTREDALKRHTKNVLNCANMNIKVRGRGTSVKPRDIDTGVSTEVS